MKLHPRIAKQLLSNLALPQAVLNIPMYHHERWAGTGYPYGLEGEQIPLPVRVFSVVDVWDALLTDRPYRKKLSEEQAREYLLSHMWTEFDPDGTSKFLGL